MNVFVTGTGRCGTVTFSRACAHITNFTCRHESKSGCVDETRFDYPKRHIEVDPHLAWTLGPLVQRYPDALYVHLQRQRAGVVESWRRRGIRPHSGAAPLCDVIFQTVAGRLSDHEFCDALGLLYDTVNANIAAALKPLRSLHVWLHDAKSGFRRFWVEIGARGDRDTGLAEFDRRYNAS